MNITEFAAFAGVSKAAVSRYFNHGYLSEEKRNQIEEALKQADYKPNVQAQNMRRQGTKFIGVIIPKLSSESCGRVVEGIGEVLRAKGYQMLLMNANNIPMREIEALELFRNHYVDGVIFLAGVFTPDHHSLLKHMRIPVVIVGQNYANADCVFHDDYGAAYEATKLMLDHGRTKPAFVGVRMDDIAVGSERLKGYEQALEDNHIKLSRSHFHTASFSILSGYEQTKRLFEKNWPDCLFCATDQIAIGAMKYLWENKIRIPQDVMVAAIGDSKIGAAAAISLTSAHLRYHTAGETAANILLDRINSHCNSNQRKRKIKLDFYVVERGTTAIDDTTIE